MSQAAMIAAIYVVLVYVFNYWSFGIIQFRIAEILTILPCFTPAAIPGLFIGCFLANLLGGAIPADILFGSIATLIGALGTYAVGNIKLPYAKWLAPLPPIVANTLIVPFVLKYGYGEASAIPYMMFTIGVSELIVCGVLGLILYFILNKYKTVLFHNN
jgi:uncharacterized membrane protein